MRPAPGSETLSCGGAGLDDAIKNRGGSRGRQRRRAGNQTTQTMHKTPQHFTQRAARAAEVDGQNGLQGQTEGQRQTVNLTTYMRADHGPWAVDGLRDLLRSLPAGLDAAEIGVYAGEGSRLFMASGKVARLCAVDPWRPFIQKTDDWESPWPWEDVRAEYLRWAAGQPDVVVYEMTSLDAASCFPPRSFDLVYIDASHDYAAVAADIRAWRPLVRPTGWLGGHDYSPAFPGVVRAVWEACERVQTFQDTSWLCAAADLRTPVEARHAVV